MKNKIRPSTLLTALNDEREQIIAALNMKPEKLRADLAAVERLIAIYQPRATEQAATAQPKALKAAAKIRADVSGNGTQPPRKHGTMTVPILQAVLKKPQPKADMIAVMTSQGMNAKGLGAFVATKLLARSESGIYSITHKGKQRLKTLLAKADRPSRPGWTPTRLKKFQATMKNKAAQRAAAPETP